MDTIKINDSGTIQVPETQTHQGVQVSGKEQTISIDTGEIYGDIVITLVIGTVIVLSIFSYGYFFGTRDVDAKVELARKMEREAVIKELENV